MNEDQPGTLTFEPRAAPPRHAKAHPVFLQDEVVGQRYRIVRALGQGGMGQVFEAADLELGEPVALKVIRPEVAARPAAVARFKREVQLARQVTHPNVCRIFDLVQHSRDGGLASRPRPVLFLTMELVRGETLAQHLRRRGAFSCQGAIPLIRQMLAALEAAHRAGVIHRDFKASNVMLSSETASSPRCVVTDFGLAQVFEPDVDPASTDPAAGSVAARPAPRPCGTPPYMSPEQLATGRASQQSDLYSLGVVAFEMLTGHRPFDAASAAELERLHREEEPPSLSKYVPEVDAGLERWILRCLEKNPRRRPSSAAEAAHTLLAWRPAKGLSLPSRPHWRLERNLGEGGFGEVWLVRHRKTGAARTLKFCYDTARLAALEREVTLFRLLVEKLGERDDFPRILDWNLDEEPFFIEAEHVEGWDLAEWAGRHGGLGEIPLRTRLDLVAGLAETLAAAHSAGIIHQDVKPANVLVCHGDAGRLRVRLNDFGSGRVGDRSILESTDVTVLGMTASTGPVLDGTLLYMAPEVLEGRAPTTQADVYALGVVLYQVIVGDFNRTLAPGWQREIDDELLAEDVARAVDGDPEHRSSARQLAEQLRTLDRRRAERREVKRRRAETERLRSTLLQARRRWRHWAAGTSVLLLVTVAMGLISRRAVRETRRARDLARVAVAEEWVERDPTRAALVLLEVEDLPAMPSALAKMRRVLGYPIARHEFRAHTDRVHRAVFSPDSRKIATAGWDKTSRLWSVDGSAAPSEFRSHEAHISVVMWSPRGDRLLTASHDGAVWVRSTDGSAPAIALRGHEKGAIWSGAFSPEGDRVVTASFDRTARVWPLDGSGEPVVFRGHEHWIFSAAFSGDGKQVVTASSDGTARVWNADGSGEPLVFRGHEGWVLNAAFSSDGKRVLTVSRDDHVRVWRVDMAGDPVVLRERTDTRHHAVFSPDGTKILTASEQGAIRLWNVDGSDQRLLSQGLPGQATAFFSPDGRRVVASLGDGSVRILEVDGTEPPIVLRGQGNTHVARFSPDGNLVVTPSEEGSVRVWDVSSTAGDLVLRGHRGPVTALAVSRDGRRVATGATDHTVRVWNAGGFATPKVLEGHTGKVRALAFDPTGALIASGSDDDTVRVCRHETGHCQVLRGHENSVVGLLFRPDGELVTISFDDSIRFWSMGESPVSRVRTIPLPNAGLIRRRVMAPDAHVVVSIDNDASARISYADATPFPRREEPIVFRSESVFRNRDETILDVVFSPESRHLLVLGSEGTVQAWTFDSSGERSPELLRVFEGYRARISSAAFSADSRHIATAWQDGTVHVRRLDGSGTTIVLEGHDGPVLATVFSPDGRYLFTASKDRTVRRWWLGYEDVRAELRAATEVCLDPPFRESQLGEEPAEARRRYEACERSHGRTPS